MYGLDSTADEDADADDDDDDLRSFAVIGTTILSLCGTPLDFVIVYYDAPDQSRRRGSWCYNIHHIDISIHTSSMRRSIDNTTSNT